MSFRGGEAGTIPAVFPQGASSAIPQAWGPGTVPGSPQPFPGGCDKRYHSLQVCNNHLHKFHNDFIQTALGGRPECFQGGIRPPGLQTPRAAALWWPEAPGWSPVVQCAPDVVSCQQHFSSCCSACSLHVQAHSPRMGQPPRALTGSRPAQRDH